MAKNKKLIAGVIAAVAVLGIIIAVMVAGRHDNGTANRNDDVIKIGAILPLTGATAHVGGNCLNGLNLAEKFINDNGGIAGKKLVIIVEDGGADAKTATAAYQKLRRIDGVRAFISGGTPISVPIARYAADEGENAIPQIGGMTNLSIFSKISPWTFRLSFDAETEAEKLFELITSKKFGKIAIYYSNDDYGRDIYENFMRLVHDPQNCTIVASQTFEQGQTNHRDSLGKIIASNPDACLFIGATPTLGIALRQAKQDGLNCQYFSSGGMLVPGTAENAGEGAEGIFFTSTSFDLKRESDTEMQKMFRKRFFEVYGVEPNNQAAISHAAVEILKESIQTSKSEELDDLLDAMHAIQNFETSMGKLSVNKNGDIFVKLEFGQWVNGKAQAAD